MAKPDFASQFDKAFRALLPSPFSIAIILTILTVVLAISFTTPADTSTISYTVDVIGFWQKGIWDPPMLVFAMQMMLMLVLGHALALTPAADNFIRIFTNRWQNSAQAAGMVAFLSMSVALFNWGLGLIFGSVLARKMAESSIRRNIPINYPLVGASAYLGMLVFHSGLSGSAPVKANEPGHIQSLMQGIHHNYPLPEFVPMESTTFSTMNITAVIACLLMLSALMYYIGSRTKKTPVSLSNQIISSEEPPASTGAERLDSSMIFGKSIGVIVLVYALWMATGLNQSCNLSFLTPDFINTVLLGSALLLHSSIFRFSRAMQEAIGDISSIIIQYPLYFGIMGIMRSSGLVELISGGFAEISTAYTFPILTFYSSAIINIFVPSGGGQWALQAPVLIEASQLLGVPLEKSIMAMVYGDQLTNMMQPLWALPLLGITGLKAKDVLPYTLLAMIAATIIFTAVLVIF
jgi:short-chain fatty acids transporter